MSRFYASFWAVAGVLFIGAALLWSRSPAGPAEGHEKPTAQPTEKPAEPSIEDRIEAALDSRQPFDFKEGSLSDLSKYLRGRHALPVILDNRLIEEAGKKECVVSLATKDVSLRSCLATMLGRHGLGMTIADEAVLITTREKVETHLWPVVYAVGDLTLVRNDEVQRWFGDVATSWDRNALEELLTETVRPETWDSNGGGGIARVLDDTLIVRQNYDAHREVKLALAALRQAILAKESDPNRTSLSADDGLAEKLRHALKRRVSLNLHNERLPQIVTQLRKTAELAIQFDDVRLEEVGISPEELRITDAFSNVALSTVLRRVLAPHGLAYVVKNEQIIVTTGEAAKAELRLRIYPVRDLVAIEVRGMSECDSEDLRNAIVSSVEPQSWEQAGGSARIRSFDSAGVLVVSQSDDAHEEIEKLLTAIRAARKSQAIAPGRPGFAVDKNEIRLEVYSLLPARPQGSFGPQSGEIKIRGALVETKAAAELVRALIEADSWNTEPQVFIRPIGSSLVVRHRRFAQDRIRELLNRLAYEEGYTPVGRVPTGRRSFVGGFHASSGPGQEKAIEKRPNEDPAKQARAAEQPAREAVKKLDPPRKKDALEDLFDTPPKKDELDDLFVPPPKKETKKPAPMGIS